MSKESFLSKLRENSSYTFLLPSLKEEIRYKKLDVIEASIKGEMPNYIASKVLDVMKNGLDGEQDATLEHQKSTDDDVKQILIKATETLAKVIIEPQLTMEEILEIGAEDRIAWFMDAISKSYTSATTSGGEVTANDVANFPDTTNGRKHAKRGSNR